MSTSKSSRKSTTAVLALALALASAGSTAQADTLFGAGSVPVRAAAPSAGLFDQAWTWMAEIADVWTGWFGVATEKETATTTTTGTPSQSSSCTPQTPCDPDTEAGWGIDPNG